jgi:mitochondrial distribution and morphology protein 10
MLGHISGAYSARVSRDLSLSSRFDFNVYSYESEWAMGAEWWMRRSPLANPETMDISTLEPRLDLHSRDDVQGVVKARASTNNVRALNLRQH